MYVPKPETSKTFQTLRVHSDLKSAKDIPRDSTLLFLVFAFLYVRATVLKLFQGGFIGIAWMCQFEVVVIGYITFKRFSGLYFWSICAATVAVVFYTIAVVLYHFVLGDKHVWVSSALLTIGYLSFIPSEFLVIYSRSESYKSAMNLLTTSCRLRLLNPGLKMVRFIQALLILEFVLVEIPATTVTLVAVNNPTNLHLLAAVEDYVGTSAVLLAVVCMIVPGLYLYLAFSESTRTT
jgi:hypothetical protein